MSLFLFDDHERRSPPSSPGFSKHSFINITPIISFSSHTHTLSSCSDFQSSNSIFNLILYNFHFKTKQPKRVFGKFRGLFTTTKLLDQ
ncbi:hypothetical protein L1987_76384 [Smallanthus sonchifolius]|uniref:Uncharacterized protein n=1 Tax=Smallanthus sonchifolius TaxID=185202 RepID=A0ACB9A8P2_9ASTR|nr:hypothetical protein L1987_76384 [Smallanthus sonchifolius]